VLVGFTGAFSPAFGLSPPLGVVVPVAGGVPTPDVAGGVVAGGVLVAGGVVAGGVTTGGVTTGGVTTGGGSTGGWG